MTPDPTGIEALLANLEEFYGCAQEPDSAQADFKDALFDAFPKLVAALRSQSRALAEREETIGRLREALQPFAEAFENARDSGLPLDHPRDYPSRKDYEHAWALASAPKGEGAE